MKEFLMILMLWGPDGRAQTMEIGYDSLDACNHAAQWLRQQMRTNRPHNSGLWAECISRK